MSFPAVVVTLFFALLYMSAAQIGATISISGTVKPDEPISTFTGVSISFSDPAGKENRTKVDKDGNFSSVILSPSTRYKVKISGSNIIATAHDFETPNVAKFTELKQNFTAITASAGKIIFSTEVFLPTKAELSTQAKTELDKLIDIMKSNRGLSVKIVLQSETELSIKKETPKPAKKSKKKSKTTAETMPTEVPTNTVSINQQRINTIQDYLKDVKSREKRISIILDSSTPNTSSTSSVTVSDPKKGKKSSTTTVTKSVQIPVKLTCAVLSMETI